MDNSEGASPKRSTKMYEAHTCKYAHIYTDTHTST